MLYVNCYLFIIVFESNYKNYHLNYYSCFFFFLKDFLKNFIFKNKDCFYVRVTF